jgi:hypothetical protein
MSPTHANKKGARYRYYVSQALLQNRKAEAGSIARVPAPETETLVCDGVRRHLAAIRKEPPTVLADRELIERHVVRVVVKPQTLEICLIPTSEAQAENPSLADSAPDLRPAAMIALPWTAPSFAAMKGVIHEPSTKSTMKPESRDALLTAIGKARGWIDDIPARPNCLLRRDCPTGGSGRTAHPPARSSRLPLASHHRSDRRWHSAGRSHGHRSRQSPALSLGRARAVDLAKHLGSANPGRRRAFNESDNVLWQQQS